jgi:hypothetical protein
MLSQFTHRRHLILRLFVLAVFCVISQPLLAHVVVRELDKFTAGDAAWFYLELGYRHILPLGLDHILFVFSLFLLSPRLKTVLWQATAFTIAHTITLGLSMYHIITPPVHIVEPLITLSILYVSLENIFSSRLKASRIGVVFLFGLVHGMGFAGALGQLGLPEHAYLLSLVMFNAGVELGQMTVILLAWFLLAKWFGQKSYYRRNFVIPFSLGIAIVSSLWTFQRLFL